MNRRFLPPYGAEGVHAPNFQRLADHSVTFDNCYVGSMPCMPARRELHTGRYNFLHRSWGPLEPFDVSMPELLRNHGVYTHLVSDHFHYWEDGGGSYHTRYSSWEGVRGQEGDLWKGEVRDPEIPQTLRTNRVNTRNWRQDWVNRKYMSEEKLHPQHLTFELGQEFIRTNAGEDNWFLQIEAFDPHEPFFTPQKYKDLYPHEYDGPHFDWPDYDQVRQSPLEVQHMRFEYAALVSMCDAHLGKVLDLMDELALWEDTLLIVGTDHGFLLGEHDWWGKNMQPYYDEVAHTPLFHLGSALRAKRRALRQPGADDRFTGNAAGILWGRAPGGNAGHPAARGACRRGGDPRGGAVWNARRAHQRDGWSVRVHASAGFGREHAVVRVHADARAHEPVVRRGGNARGGDDRAAGLHAGLPGDAHPGERIQRSSFVWHAAV